MKRRLSDDFEKAFEDQGYCSEFTTQIRIDLADFQGSRRRDLLEEDWRFVSLLNLSTFVLRVASELCLCATMEYALVV